MIYVLTHEEGGCDEARMFIDGLVSGPVGKSMKVLYGEHCKFKEDLRKSEYAAWVASPRKKAPIRYSNPKSFLNWLVEDNKGFRHVLYEEVDPTY